MTKETIAKDLEVTKLAQCAAILDALSRWCDAAPGRRVSVERTADGWRASLDTSTVIDGATMTDALAQVAQVAAFGGPEDGS